MGISNDCLSAIMFNSENMALAIERGITEEWFSGSDSKLYSDLVEAFASIEWNNRNGVTKLHSVYMNNPVALSICDETPSWAFNIEDVGDAFSLLADERARSLVTQALSGGHTALLEGTDPFSVIRDLVDATEGITGLLSNDTSRGMEDVCNDALTIDTAIANGDRIGLPFPWVNFQRMTFGVPNKSVTPLAGRDGMGKSRLAQYLTFHWVKQGIPILYFPFEDTSERMVSNMASTLGGYDMFDIKRHYVPQDFINKHAECLDKIKKMPLYTDDFACTAEVIVSTIAKHKRKYGIEGVVIDGFKDLVASGGENRTQQENNMMGVLVRAAHKYSVSIIPISHLTKVEDGKWISKSSIKGSSNLSQSARMSLMFQDCDPPDVLRAKYPHVDLNDCVILDCQKASYGSKTLVVLKPNLERGGFDEVKMLEEM